MSKWISVDGYENLPNGEWLVVVEEAIYKMTVHTAYKADLPKGGSMCFLAGHFAFDQPKIIGYRSIPVLDANDAATVYVPAVQEQKT